MKRAPGTAPAAGFLFPPTVTPAGAPNDAATYVLNRMTIDESDCWIWKLSLDRYGYGKSAASFGHGRLAHRVSYAAFCGPIPDGMELDHLCRVRSCVNPKHLEPVTHKENTRRGSNAPSTHCRRGHEYTPASVYLRRNGDRVCRICANANHRERRRRAAA